MKLISIFAITLLFCIVDLISAEDDVYLPPIKSGSEHVAVIYVQGAQIPVNNYINATKVWQKLAPFPLWIAIPNFPLDAPNPATIGSVMSRAFSKLADLGLPSDAKIFISGHSLGGAMVQDWTNTNYKKHNIKGQILNGAFLVRKYRNKTYPCPTLTIGGELDGLCRVSRIAEAYHVQVEEGSNPADFPVVVINGMSHLQFAEGAPPSNVKNNDLKPEITFDQAHILVAKHAVNWMIVKSGYGNVGSASASLNSAVSASATVVSPMIKGLKLEGFYHFKPPCYDNPCSESCQCGCPWTEQHSQISLAGLKDSWGVKPLVTDQFHQVWKIPFHLPNIWNNCTGKAVPCVLNITTVTQAVYSDLDPVDTGFYPTSASELRTKMVSRQRAYSAAGHWEPFDQTDSNQQCAELNKKAIAWGKANASPQALDRFNKFGVPYTVGDDVGPLDVGPLWIWTALKYVNKTVSGTPVVELQSPFMKTSLDYKISLSAGFHYCKALSPARIMEWIMIDSLRLRRSIKN